MVSLASASPAKHTRVQPGTTFASELSRESIHQKKMHESVKVKPVNPVINRPQKSGCINGVAISKRFFIIYGYITNSQCDQLSVGLIAQLVEHYTGITEVMGSNPVQA